MSVQIASALHPLREALLAHARADAQACLAAAELEAARTVDAARGEAGGIRAAARRSGAADARAVRSADLARARRQARTLALAAQRAGYDALRARVGDVLRAGAPAGALRRALAARARAVLGPDARIVDHPSGGVVGEAPGRRVDCSVEALVDRVLTTDGGSVAGLWSS